MHRKAMAMFAQSSQGTLSDDVAQKDEGTPGSEWRMRRSHSALLGRTNNESDTGLWGI